MTNAEFRYGNDLISMTHDIQNTGQHWGNAFITVFAKLVNAQNIQSKYVQANPVEMKPIKHSLSLKPRVG